MASVFQPNIFNGKVVFCTGGRSGICYKIVEQLMALGANATIVGRDAKGLAESAAALEKTTGRKCLPTPADVRKTELLKAAVEATIQKYGKIDFVICGAAGNFLAPVSGLSENAFRTVIEIDTASNILGTFNTIKATLPYVRQTKGAYLHISATLHYRGLPFQAHVSAAKAGVDALSQALAVEEGPRGVRSNVIAPGPIGNTEGMSRLGTSRLDPRRTIPLGAMGETQDIANAAIFLFSPAASIITGQVLVVDGGQQHMGGTQLPYPEAVLDPVAALKAESKGKL